MIKGIFVKNFKGIGDPGIKLELEPITLLFGSNSAGKSTIFHAFLYAYEVLVNRNYNVDRTTLGGDGVDLGGFITVVHDHKQTNTIEIEIDLDLSSAQLDREWRIAESLVGTDDNEVDLSALGTDVWHANVKFKIKWDGSKKQPFVARFSVAVDEDPLLTIWCEEDSEEVNSRVNYRHAVFGWPTATGPSEQGSAGVLDSLYSPFQTISDQWFWRDGIEPDEDMLDISVEEPEDPDDPGPVVFGELPEQGSDLSSYRVIEDVDNASHVLYFYEYDVDQQKAILRGSVFTPGPDWSLSDAEAEWTKRLTLDREDLFRPILVLEQDDALPPFDRPLQLLLAPDTEPETRDLIRDVVSRLALGPARMLARELKDFRHIGPLREIPPRSFRETLSPNPARWCSGLAAWDKLSAAEDDFVEAVSKWLSSTDRLGTGYSLIRKRYKELEPDGYIMQILKRENPLDNLAIALEGIDELPEFRRLILRDENTQVEIDPPDIAVGLTQLIPIIVAALDDHDGITLTEQPELHNHPAVEVGLGDLFITAIDPDQSSCRFLIETHGEHLLLRMLRRIRETAKGTVGESLKLNASKLAIYYISKDKSHGDTTAQRIEVDIEGEFIQPWPDDFFEIDFKERFD